LAEVGRIAPEPATDLGLEESEPLLQQHDPSRNAGVRRTAIGLRAGICLGVEDVEPDTSACR
jgi:hypothetical protein